MLVLEYLNGGKTLENLKQEFGIDYKIEEIEGVDHITLNYCQISSPKGHPLADQCRGLTLYRDFGNVYKLAGRTFDRFYNLGETCAKPFPKNPFVYEKLDGSLIRVFYSPKTSQWVFGTRGTCKADGCNGQSTKTFQELITEALGGSVGRSNLIASMDTRCTYIFELVSPVNRIVTPYKETELVLLGIRSNIEPYNYIDESVEAVFLGNVSYRNRHTGVRKVLRKAKEFHLTDENELQEFVESLDGLNEGVVVYDGDTGVPVCKIKASLYVKAHKMRGELGLTPKRIASLVVDNEVDEYLAYFPDDAGRFTSYQEALHEMLDGLVRKFTVAINTSKDQKEFALQVKDVLGNGILFSMKKTSESCLTTFNNMTENKKIELLISYMEKNKWDM